jgi:hypothetical protein
MEKGETTTTSPSEPMRARLAVVSRSVQGVCNVPAHELGSPAIWQRPRKEPNSRRTIPQSNVGRNLCIDRPRG